MVLLFRILEHIGFTHWLNLLMVPHQAYQSTFPGRSRLSSQERQQADGPCGCLLHDPATIAYLCGTNAVTRNNFLIFLNL
jgi:hypothetical protein